MIPKKTSHRPAIKASPEPKIVGMARNEFGTRLCQRVECTRCQKTDYVPVRVAANKGYCRACAELVLKTFDTGRYIAPKTIKHSCTQCKRSFEASLRVADKKDDIMCPDCYRGFDVWRGKAGTKPNQTLISRIGLGGQKTIIRKGTNDTI